ncbi:MAG: cytochrome c [Planctomycetes bacterium]|nr:cytochrome c [Planctomycetota bacterium]
MRPTARLALALLALAAGGPAAGQDRIDRREEARKAQRATGAGLFESHCAICHSKNAAGTTRKLWSDDLGSAPPDLSGTALDHTDLVTFLSGGSSATGQPRLCPSWGRALSSEEKERLALHVARLGTREREARETPTRGGGPVTESFPWGLLAVLVVEVALLGRLWRKKEKAHGG